MPRVNRVCWENWHIRTNWNSPSSMGIISTHVYYSICFESCLIFEMAAGFCFTPFASGHWSKNLEIRARLCLLKRCLEQNGFLMIGPGTKSPEEISARFDYRNKRKRSDPLPQA